MTKEPYSPIGPETSHPPEPRRLLRAGALAVLAMGAVLLVRTGMKPPDPRKAASLIILGTFLAANAAPLLLSLKLRRNAASLRVLAVCGVVVDALLFLVMSLYAMLVVHGQWNRANVLAVGSSLSAAVVCGAALALRPGPLDDRTDNDHRRVVDAA